MSTSLTVSDSKRAFHRAFPYVIAPLYRRVVDELLVELHLLSHQKGFQPDALFAAGLVQVFDGFARGYRPPEQKEPLFVALCASSGFEASALRDQRQAAVDAVSGHDLETVKQWLDHQGEGAPEPLGSALASIQRPEFHYTRLLAVGLLSLLQQAKGAESMEPEALRQASHEVAERIGLIRSRVDKDLGIYASNLERMAQAVELMEETVAAERRRRERAANGEAEATESLATAPDSASTQLEAGGLNAAETAAAESH
ncbi:photosystem II biogenesis protein Psp29 [Cyanobium sp. Morenito 9A2]|uniref:photosystem II biogenesis protein Psp29 n=1 Tax=Cyanobium sp. Morenito 9A2 TaxID=2823718 RepID=UPI0020CD5AA9|nr:photosystem II biogenesis protein Psp29 [Cyanobium sp. Morenito 9A2]MCP9850132.1 photosystem II biogenesis protein Psp29 [Cyanobium sp. Morenito 9A2]